MFDKYMTKGEKVAAVVVAVLIPLVALGIIRYIAVGLGG